MLALYGSTVHPRYIMWFSGQLFFRLVCTLACYTLTLSRKKVNLNNVIHGGFASTLGDNFYMGMQNGLKLEI